MRLLIRKFLAKLKYPYYLFVKLDSMAKEHDAMIDTMNKNNAEVLERINALSRNLSSVNKSLHHLRKRHNALVKK